MKKTLQMLIFALCLLLGGCCPEEVAVLPPDTRPSVDASYTLLVKTETGVEPMGLRDYLAGVLLGEMPADFSTEALKAQAIAARTYALRKAATARHPDAHVCSQSSCCQGWSSIDACDEAVARRLYHAVDETDGLVLTYEGALIDATFFSCSGGRTESAVAVWGGDVPYLQAVDSPGEEAAPVFQEERHWSAEELRTLLQEALPEAVLTGAPETWFTELQYSPGGGVETLKLGGVALSGTGLRQLLGLRSTRLSIELREDQICIRTYGYGHRVGLSQYGAQAMAQAGSSYREILQHYYQGTRLQKLSPETQTGQEEALNGAG